MIEYIHIGNDFVYKNYTVGYCTAKGKYEGYILIDNEPKYMFRRGKKGLKLFNTLEHEKSPLKKLPKELIGMIYSHYANGVNNNDKPID